MKTKTKFHHILLYEIIVYSPITIAVWELILKFFQTYLLENV